jgi:hypothetical protein
MQQQSVQPSERYSTAVNFIVTVIAPWIMQQMLIAQ